MSESLENNDFRWSKRKPVFEPNQNISKLTQKVKKLSCPQIFLNQLEVENLLF